jgi:hypothetical protein
MFVSHGETEKAKHPIAFIGHRADNVQDLSMSVRNIKEQLGDHHITKTLVIPEMKK